MSPLPLPEPLLQARRYLPWCRTVRPNGRSGKVPHAVQGSVLRPCSPLRPAHWLPLEEALALVTAGEADGIGLALDEALGVTGFDLDDCLRPGGYTPAAREVLAVLGDAAYVERSPGGRGVHALVNGRTPPGWRRRPAVELITTGFLTVTGHVLQPAPDPWPDLTPGLRAWHAAQQPQRPRASPPNPAGLPDDDRLLERALQARSGPTFRALWSAHPDAAPSPSEGDVRLLLMLLYWGGPHISDTRLDALFRRSCRYRPKWDAQHGPATYGQRTIAAARAIHKDPQHA